MRTVMMPIVFRIPFIERDIPGYGLMLMLGFLISIIWATRRAVRSGANPDVVLNLGFVALIAGVIGARGMYVVHYWEQFKDQGSLLSTIWGIVDVTRGGLEFYGGFVLTIIAVVVWLRFYEKVSLRWYFDIVAPSAALGLAFGRLGCLLNGCCYGGVCSDPWAMQFPYGSNAAMVHWATKLPGAELPKELMMELPLGIVRPLLRESLAATDREIQAAEARYDELRKKAADIRERIDRGPDAQEAGRLRNELKSAEIAAERANAQFRDIRTNMAKYNLTPGEMRAIAARHRSLPVHPTQIYESVAAFLLAMLLSAIYWRRRWDGQVVCTLLLVQPIGRYLLEVIRADNPIDTLGFTVSQFIAIFLTLVGAAGFLMLRTLPPRSPRAKLFEPEPDCSTRKAVVERPVAAGR